MQKLSKPALYVSTALGLCLALPTEVWAADAQGGGIEEIVVTARRVEERLQDVPISITVFNQRQLTDRNIASAQDLGLATPALTVNTQFGVENSSFSLHGFSPEIGTSATVGVYFADVVAPRGGLSNAQTHGGDGAGPGSFFDLQNVQILKGPQGTLFGRNTTGGDVLIVPNKPTDKYEGYLEASGGNYDLEHIQAVVNVPVNDKVRFRVGVDEEQRDGFMKNISGVGPKDFNNINYVAARVSLDVNVTDDIENYTVGSFSQSDNNGVLAKYVACKPSGLGLFGDLSCDQLKRDKGKFVAENDYPDANSFQRNWQVINTTTWQATDDISVKNTASYSQVMSSLASSLFGDNWKFEPSFLTFPTVFFPYQHYFFTGQDTAPGYNGSYQQNFTDELQLHGTAFDGKLDWQTGLYMEGSHPLGLGGADSPFLVACADFKAGQCFDPFSLFGTTQGNTHTSLGSITNRNYAAYGQATYSILDNLQFEAGLRVTDDSTTGQDFLYKATYPSFANPQPVPGCQVIPSVATLASNCLLSLHTSSRAPTWVLKLSYQPIEDINAYASYSRGYRQGGIYGTAPVDATFGTAFTKYKPESVDDYQIGVKTTFHGAVPAMLDISGFYDNFSNQQLQGGFNSTLATPTAAIFNAGNSRIYGVDFTGTIVPFEGVTLSVDYSYLNTKLVSVNAGYDPGDSIYSAQPSAVPGSVLPYSPHNKGTVNLTYRLPMDDSHGKITLGTTYTYTGAQAVSPTTPYGYLHSYNTFNFNANWESVEGYPVDLEFFMTNAFNKLYETYVSDMSQTLGYVSVLYGDPRMFGGRVRYHFGESGAAPETTAPYVPPAAVVPAPAPVAHSYMVFFDFNKSDLTPEAVSIVDEAAKNAAPAKATTITVTGHTDTVGSDAYNMRLSKRRAESVAAELEKEGVPSSEIALVAKGKRDLLVPTKDGVREPQNRRVTIVYDGGANS